MLFSISSKNSLVFLREREVSCPTASCSWVSALSTQAYNWDWGGSVSLARAASVRLGGSVLLLSHHMMVSKMVSDLDQE